MLLRSITFNGLDDGSARARMPENSGFSYCNLIEWNDTLANAVLSSPPGRKKKGNSGEDEGAERKWKQALRENGERTSNYHRVGGRSWDSREQKVIRRHGPAVTSSSGSRRQDHVPVEGKANSRKGHR